MCSQVLLHLVLDMEGESVLEETTYLSAVLAVAITDGKEVTVLESHDVR